MTEHFCKTSLLKAEIHVFGCYFHFIAVLFRNIEIVYKVCEI